MVITFVYDDSVHNDAGRKRVCRQVRACDMELQKREMKANNDVNTSITLDCA